MKHEIISTFFILFCLTVCNAQTVNKSKNSAVSFEVGKTGLIYNLNFDHKLQDKDFGFHLGIGSSFSKYLTAFTTGCGGYYLIGQGNNFFEFGIDINYLSVDEVSDDQKGFAFFYPDYTIKTYYVSSNIGYRRYGKESLFRIGLSPGFIKKGFIPGGYVSYGLTFKMNPLIGNTSKSKENFGEC